MTTPTAAQVHDALAVKILTGCTDLKNVYGDGSVDDRVKPWPEAIVQMPAALIHRGDTAREAGLSRELYTRQWEADFYLPAVKSAASAIRLINRLDTQLLDEFATGVSLGGLVSVVRYLGSGRPVYREEGEDEATTQYVIWQARFETQERRGRTYTT